MNNTTEIFDRIEHFKIEQRSPEWFQIRLGKFTSSNIYKLFASATKEKRAAAALNGWYVADEIKTTATAAEINYACKKLGFTEEETKQAKKDCKEAKQRLTVLSEKVLKFWRSVCVTNPDWIKSANLSGRAAEINYACKKLGFTEEETKQAKKDCKEAKQRLTVLSEKVLKFCNCLDNIHTFSEGAETFILEKAAEFIFSDKDSIFVNDAMLWGIENEEEAKKQYLKKTGFMGLDVGFIEAGNNTGSSPDLLVSVASENIGLAEFKCPNQLNHLKNIINIKTAEDLKKHHLNYWFQCQHQIFCSGRSWCDFVSFHPNLLNGPYSALSLHIVRIPKDEKIQAEFAEILPKAAALRDKYIKELLNKI